MPALTAGCVGSQDAEVSVIAIGSPASPFEKGARLPPPAQALRAATAEGLIGLDEQGQVTPALADRWIVTDDGLSYIFRLRDGKWPDGSAISAESTRNALRQALTSLRGTPLSLDLEPIADLRVMASRVIELRLSRPQPDLLQLLAQPELGLYYRGRGGGPMRLRRDGDEAMLRVIPPSERGLPQAEDWQDMVRDVRFRSMPVVKAIAAFDEGEADVVMGGRFVDLNLADRRGIGKGTLLLDPVSGLFGLVVISRTGLLADRENREAVAMAIDRDELGGAIGPKAWTTQLAVVPAGVGNSDGAENPGWAGIDLAERQRQAAARIAKWRETGGKTPALRIALPGGPGSDALFAGLTRDLGTTGLAVTRVNEGAPADLRLLDAVARYGRSDWYLNQLSCAALKGPCSAAADRLLAEARKAAGEERNVLLARAEAELASENVFIPLGLPIRWTLVRGEPNGLAANRWAIHPLMPMARRPK
jgi:peptide/nickel transport system substrate-binding protein/oligopeptide transport system substrate-binding protein